MCMFLYTHVVCIRCDHGPWQKNGHHKPSRAQRILHPCHQKSRSLALALLVIKTESRRLCTSYSRHLCPVSVRGSGAAPRRWGVSAWLLCQRWLRHLVPEKGDVEDTFVIQHRPLRGLPFPAGDSSSTSQKNKSSGLGLSLNVYWRCVFLAPVQLPERSAHAAKCIGECFASPAGGAAICSAAYRSGTSGAALNVSRNDTLLSNEYTVE